MVPQRKMVHYRVAISYVVILTSIAILTWHTFVSNPQPSQGLVAEESYALQPQLEQHLPVADLVALSDLIVRGRIIDAQSEWNADHTAITTLSTLETIYPIRGNPEPFLMIQTDGGFIEGDIGMKSSDSPLFAEGEEVVLFLYEDKSEDKDVLKVTSGELGKYSMIGRLLTNPLLPAPEKASLLYEQIHMAMADLDQTVQTPDNWQAYENDTAENDTAPNKNPNKDNGYERYEGRGFVYKNRKWGGTCPEVVYKININTAQAGGKNGSVAQFRDAIISAANTWNSAGRAAFVLKYAGETDATTTGFNGSNEIIFSAEGLSKPTGLARFWFTSDFTIVEADIWLNDDFNWDATGKPKFTEVDLQSVALHEFGHWLALGHDESVSTVMHPKLTMGTLKRELHQNEIDGIGFIYPLQVNSPCS